MSTKLSDLEKSLIAKKKNCFEQIDTIDETLRLLAMKRLHPDTCKGDRFRSVWLDTGASMYNPSRHELVLHCGVSSHHFHINDVPDILCTHDILRNKQRHARRRR